MELILIIMFLFLGCVSGGDKHSQPIEIKFKFESDIPFNVIIESEDNCEGNINFCQYL